MGITFKLRLIMSCIEFAITVQYGGLSLWACLEINKHCTILCFPTKVWMWQTHNVVPTHPPNISMNQCTCPHDPKDSCKAAHLTL